MKQRAKNVRRVGNGLSFRVDRFDEKEKQMKSSHKTVPFSGDLSYGRAKRALHAAGYYCRAKDVVITGSHRDRKHHQG